jgi:putative ATPase
MTTSKPCCAAPRRHSGGSCRSPRTPAPRCGRWLTATAAFCSIWSRNWHDCRPAPRSGLYDKAQEGHYNLISALHKSLRGSDTDAALYWLARMLAGGEDPIYILRRLTRAAVEDVGLADPQAVIQALSAWDAYDRLGSPEGELAIAQCVIYLATAPKSNAAYTAFGEAREMARETGSLMPPLHILNAPTRLMRDLGYGKGYVYDHATEEGFSGQNYFPEGVERRNFYRPGERGFEREVRKRLDYWAKLRERAAEVQP